MTTAWRTAPCQRMRRIQITQWSWSRTYAIYSRKPSLDAGGFTEESGIVLVRCLATPRQMCGCYASTSESGSIRQLSLQSKFLPSFRERYSPPNPENASIGRNLTWADIIWHWKFKVKVEVKGTIVSVASSWLIFLFVSHQLDQPFLRYGK